jgi:ubiquinone/menaquinone biosynthesis C-methylase UbiE
MYSGSEIYYDDIYSAMGKDYAAEAYKLHEFIQKYKRTDGNTLLDMACGTGTHAGFLSQYYQVTGADLNSRMLKVARKKHPEIKFVEGDMRSLKLGRKFDVITCLFSAIGYMKTKADLRLTLRSMSRHLLPGGVLLVEPWFSEDQWNVGRVSINRVEKPDLKIIRMALARKRGKVSLLEFQYLIGTSKGIQHLTEHLELGLFDHGDYEHAFTRAGLQVFHDPEGIFGRGLCIGTRPKEQS